MVLLASSPSNGVKGTHFLEIDMTKYYERCAIQGTMTPVMASYPYTLK
jgi:hypothetical protein